MKDKKSRKPKSPAKNPTLTYEPKQNHTPEGPAEEYIHEYDDDEMIIVAEEVVSRSAFEKSRHPDVGSSDYNAYEG